jgi:arabinose-5-phosphate isomerase
MNESIGRSQFTIQQEQIALVSVQSLVNSDAFLSAIELLQTRNGKIVVTGLGKSSYIAQKIAASMASLGHSTIFLHPSEAFHGDIGNIIQNDILIALSFSGETKEVVRLAQYAKKHFSTPVISITGNTNSSLSSVSTVSLVLDIENEGCAIGVPPMASAIGTLALGDCLSSAITEPSIFSHKEFARFHPGGSLGLQYTSVVEVMKTGEQIPLVGSDVTFVEAVTHLNNHSFGVIGLVRNTELVGVLTDGDIRRGIIANSNDIQNMSALSFASRKPVTATPQVSLAVVLALMESNEITSLFIKDAGIVGFVHMHDVLKFLE